MATHYQKDGDEPVLDITVSGADRPGVRVRGGSDASVALVSVEQVGAGNALAVSGPTALVGAVAVTGDLTVDGVILDDTLMAGGGALKILTGVNNRLFPQTSGAGGTSTSTALTFGTNRLAPIIIPNTILVSHIGAEVLATVGSDGNRLRLALYADNGSGYPGALLKDAGHVASNFAQVFEKFIGTNVLTANQSGLEVDTTGWAAGASTTITRSTTQKFSGAASLRLDSTAAADASATTPTGVSGIAVTPGVVYAAQAWFRSGATPRACTVRINWYKVGGAASDVTPTTTGSSVTTTTAGWGTSTAMVAAPADAAFASVVVYVTAAGGSNELHYADDITFGRADTGLILTPGLYWGGGMSQGATTEPNVRTVAGNTAGLVSTGIPSAGGSMAGYSEAVTSGATVTTALPATFAATISSAGAVPRIHFRLGA